MKRDGLILSHDISILHTTQATVQKLQGLNFEAFIRNKTFLNRDVNEVVGQFITEKDEFFKDGIYNREMSGEF